MTLGSLLMGQGRDLVATWLAGGQGPAGGPAGPQLVLAGGVAGALAGFAAAYLGARALAGFVTASRAVRPPDRPRRSERPAPGGPPITQLAICAGVAVAAALAIESCGGQPDDGVTGTGGWALGAPAVGIGVGLLLGAAGGTLLAVGLRSPRGVTRAPAGRLVDVVVACLPDSDRQRWQEEWRGELSALPSRLARVRFCLSLLLGAPRMGWTLRTAAWRRRGG